MRASFIARIIGLIVFGIIGYQIGLLLAGTPTLTQESWRLVVLLSLLGCMIGATLTPWLTVSPTMLVVKSVRSLPAAQIVAASIGLALGLIVAALLALPLSLLPDPLNKILPFISTIVLSYLGITVMVLRQKDIFAVFAGRWGHEPSESPELPALLDTSVIIDGRIADICETGFIRGTLIVPRFVLNELQYIADSADALRRNRGRRGLEILNKLKKEAKIPVRFIDTDVPDVRQVDEKLIHLARDMGCPIVTNDYNLNRVAGLQGVVVLNVNELANAVKSVVLPGEAMHVHIIQEGKESGQGVAYLEDGTMVVVENGRRFLNSNLDVVVTKVLQTNAGRMIFAQPDGRN